MDERLKRTIPLKHFVIPSFVRPFFIIMFGCVIDSSNVRLRTEWS